MVHPHIETFGYGKINHVLIAKSFANSQYGVNEVPSMVISNTQNEMVFRGPAIDVLDIVKLIDHLLVNPVLDEKLIASPEHVPCHRPLDRGDVSLAYERVKTAFLTAMPGLLPFALEVAQAEIVFVNEEQYDAKTEESLFEGHCFMQCLGPKAEMEPLIEGVQLVCKEVGHEFFPVTDKNVILSDEQEKEFRELQAKVKADMELKMKEDIEQSKQDKETAEQSETKE